MKNLIIILLLVTNMVASAQTNHEIKKEQKYYAKMGVRSVTQTAFQYVYSYKKSAYVLQMPGFKIVSKVFNAQGGITSQVDYDDYGAPVSRTKNKFDLKGNMIETAVYNMDGTLIQRNTFKYDTKGSITEMGTYGSDNKLDHINPMTPTYDERGDLVKITAFDDAGNELSREEMKYDDHHRCIEDNLYANNIYTEQEVYRWSPGGDMTEWEHHNMLDDFKNFKQVYSRDEAGRLVQVKLYDANSMLYQTDIYKMNGNRLLVQVDRYDSLQKLIGCYKTTYNDN
jgi:hypothetical protein